MIPIKYSYKFQIQLISSRGRTITTIKKVCDNTFITSPYNPLTPKREQHTILIHRVIHVSIDLTIKDTEELVFHHWHQIQVYE